MIGNLRPASDPEIERLLAHPAEIARFLYSPSTDAPDGVCLGKTWHAIHFALNGSRLGGDEPLNFLISEGTPVGEVLPVVIDVGGRQSSYFSELAVRPTRAGAVFPITQIGLEGATR